MRIDLHTHSAHSDGTDSPAELVAAAAAAGLDVVALTDHDTTTGWAEAAAAVPPGLRLVRGCELSCTSETGTGGTCTVHLLGYLFDPDAAEVVGEQRRLRAERRTRLERIARRMRDDGFPVDPEQVMAGVPAQTSAGRPHLARALIEAGVVGSVGEAFDKYLHDGGRYHIQRADTPVRDAIAMVHAAGGVTVFAHAYATVRGATVNADVIRDLAAHGLAGLEVDHPDHPPAARAELRGLADELGLLVTGSSDYHGDNKVLALGQETTDPGELDRLLGKASGVPVIEG